MRILNGDTHSPDAVFGDQMSARRCPSENRSVALLEAMRHRRSLVSQFDAISFYPDGTLTDPKVGTIHHTLYPTRPWCDCRP